MHMLIEKGADSLTDRWGGRVGKGRERVLGGCSYNGMEKNGRQGAGALFLHRLENPFFSEKAEQSKGAHGADDSTCWCFTYTKTGLTWHGFRRGQKMESKHPPDRNARV